MKTLSLVLLSLLSLNAFATKARLASLNQDTNGSYYILDTRNIFLNPAQISSLKDHANFEWGRAERPGTSSPQFEDRPGTTAPQYSDAEGGFVTALGGGKLGVQLGRMTDFSYLIREINADMPDITTNITNSVFGEGQNNIDLIYGMDAGNLRWGGGLAITRSKYATGQAGHQTSVQAFDLRGGVQNDKFEGFGSILLGAQSATDATTTTAKLDESFGLRVGGGLQLNPALRVYAHASYDKYEASLGDGTFDYNGKRLGLLGGLACIRNLATNNARVVAAVELNYLNNDATENHGNPEEQYEMLATPVTISVEADATTWLRMRASVRQNVLLGSTKLTNGNSQNDNNVYQNAPNNTSVAAGAGASLNAFNFDLALVQSLGDDHGRLEGSMTYLF